MAVLVVLVVAYVVTGQLKKKSAEKENEEKQIAVLDMSDITSIQYTNGTDTMSFIKEDGTWYSESDKEFPLQQSSLKTMAETFGTLSANRDVYKRQRNMYIQDKEEWEYHRKTFGEHTKFGYKDFIQMFHAEKFDPKQWAKLFKAAGAKYVFPVAEHHDGFQMYKSEISKYNAFDMGPKRDLLDELREAIEEENLMFCTSSHRAEHWFFMGHGK